MPNVPPIKDGGNTNLPRQIVKTVSGVDAGASATPASVAEQLGFDSVTHYQYVHFTDIDRDYTDIMVDVQKEWAHMDSVYPIPYFPHVSVGWDNNPRFETFRPGITGFEGSFDNLRFAL